MGNTLIINGVVVDDDRNRPGQILSSISEDPFRGRSPHDVTLSEAPSDRGGAISLLRRFPVFKTICRSGKGGVFVAVDLTKSNYAEVIVKIGLRNGQSLPDGRDGAHFVSHEHAMYRMLAERGTELNIPSVLAYSEEPAANILVITLADGQNMAEWRLLGGNDICVLKEVLAIIERIHDAGLFLGDAKTSNFVKTQRGLVLVDLEAMGSLEVHDGHASPSTFSICGLADLNRKNFDLLHFLVSSVYRCEGDVSIMDASHVIDITNFISSLNIRDEWDREVAAQLRRVVLAASSND